MLDVELFSRADQVLVLNGWSCPTETWDEFRSLVAVPVQVISAQDAMFLDPSWLETLLERLSDQSVVVGWSLGGMRAIKLACVCEKRDLAAEFHVWNAGPIFTSKSDLDFGMSAELFSEFSALAGSSDSPGSCDALVRRFPFMVTQGSRIQKQDLKLLRTKFLESGLPDATSLERGLTELDRLNLCSELKEMHRDLHFVFGENDGLVSMKQADWIKRYCPNQSVNVIPDMGHFPLGGHLNELVKTMSGRSRLHYGDCSV